MNKKVRRATTAVLALAFGYGASWVAFNASSSASDDGERGKLLGTLDFFAVCRDLYGDQAVATQLRLDAYGWSCFYTVDHLYTRKEIDMAHACETLYSGITYARSTDLTSGSSWQCFRGPPP